jgi:hypothetical protein
MKRWPNLTILELWCVVWLATELSKPAAVQPVIIPGRRSLQ